jgi:arylsulfatase A-like enzyme
MAGMSQQRRGPTSRSGAAKLLARVVVAVAALGLASCGGPAGNGRNVLLLVIDTLRADHLGLYGYERPVSPEIDAWAARGAVFDRSLATSPWTLPSFGTLFTGHLPSRHTAGVVAPSDTGEPAFVRMDGSVRTLAEILGDAGYATVAIVNNPFLNPGFDIGRGFDTYDYMGGDNARIRRANVIVDRACAWLATRSERRPFFMVAHFFDPHMDYDPPPAVRGRFKDGYEGSLTVPIADLHGVRAGKVSLDEKDKSFIVGAYDEEVLFVDTQAGRLLEGFRSRGLLDDTLVVFVSDHGEEFWDHGGFEHGHTMFQELLHVPMVVWGPGVQVRRITEPVSIADIYPTVLEALELPAEEGLTGRSLWGALSRGEPIPERALVAEGNLYGPERKTLIRWPQKVVLNLQTRERKLFDLEADPGETQNLAQTELALLNSLLSELQSHLRAASRELVRHNTAELDEATKEKLRALGYLD